MSNVFITDTGVTIYNVHDETSDCHRYGCVIHRPTDTRGLPTHWDEDGQRIVRLGRMGEYVDDPDVVAYEQRRREKIRRTSMLTKHVEWKRDNISLTIEEAREIRDLLYAPREVNKRYETARWLSRRIEEVERQNEARLRIANLYPGR